MPGSRNAYGLAQRALIEAVMDRDNLLAARQKAFEAALDEGEFDGACREIPNIIQILQVWLRLQFSEPG